jgi:hypothetical protein
MTLRQVPRGDILAGLEGAEGEAFLECRTALVEDSRSSFTTTEAPAALLGRNLEPKFRIARSRGKTIEGDSELLAALFDLGEDSISAFVFDAGARHVVLYVRAFDLRPVGCVVMTPGHA